jgi:hypothetical protein
MTVATQEPQAPEVEQPQPRYAEGVDELSAKVLAVREQVGRAALAAFAEQTQSAIWRWERSRVHPEERDALVALVGRIEAGELPVPEPRAAAVTKAELTHRIEVVIDLLGKSRGDRKVSKSDLVDAALAVLAPQAS